MNPLSIIASIPTVLQAPNSVNSYLKDFKEARKESGKLVLDAFWRHLAWQTSA